MKSLDSKIADRLHRILSKRLGRQLSQSELEHAYLNLMSFAYTLYALNPISNPKSDKIIDIDTKGIV